MLTEGLCCNQAQVVLISGGSILFVFLIGALIYYKYKGNYPNSSSSSNYRRLRRNFNENG